MLEEQFAAQLQTLTMPDRVYELIRKALYESHVQEKDLRDAAISTLRRRQDEIQKRQDILLDRLLDETVGQEVYNDKYTALQNEKAEIMSELEAHERANERFFEEAETLLSFARRLADIFANGSPERKMTLLKVLASNAVLDGGKARLNLRPAFEVLAKKGTRPKWLGGQDSNPDLRLQRPPA